MQKPKIFISYSNKDIAWARQFVDALQALGVEVWFAERQVPPGRPLQAEVEKALRESDSIVTLLTPDSAQTPNLFFELGAAVGLGKNIIPVVPTEMDQSQLPPPLRARQVLVRSTPKDTAKRLAARLKPEAA
jgi:predicted nucleotide-binding protein